MTERRAIVVTGATGFVGRAVVEALLARADLHPRAAVRGGQGQPLLPCEMIAVGDIDELTDWRACLHGAYAVVHTAARVHVMTDKAQDPLSAYRAVNTMGTLSLARQAAAAGVKRFIFISTIKVNGEETPLGHAFKADDTPQPLDPYGVSKVEAEHSLFKLGQETGMEIVAIRPPLVYGPEVRANFLKMMCWLLRGVPLPFGCMDNKRSLVSRANLVSLILCCLDHPRAGGQVFLVSDGEDLTLTQLLQKLALYLGVRARLLPVPAWLLRGCAKLVGRSDMAQRLCGSLVVDIQKTRDILGWSPVQSVDEGLKETAQDFLKKTEPAP